MYFFGFGGDIPRFFKRYRERLHERPDIARVSGLSDGDLAQLTALYPRIGARAASAVPILGPIERAPFPFARTSSILDGVR